MCSKVPVMIGLHLEIFKNNFGGQLRDVSYVTPLHHIQLGLVYVIC